MVVRGKKYHPGIIKLQERNLVNYSESREKYELTRLKHKGKRHYISERQMYRIASYLYYKDGRAKDRPISTPLSKMYGLQKQRYERAKRQPHLYEATLLGKRKTPAREVTRIVEPKRTKKVPKIKIKEQDMKDIIGRQYNKRDFIQWSITRSGQNVIPARYIIRLIRPDGKPQYGSVIKYEVRQKIRKEVFNETVINIAQLYRKRYRKRGFFLGGTLAYQIKQPSPHAKKEASYGEYTPMVSFAKAKQPFEKRVLTAFSKTLDEFAIKIKDENFNQYDFNQFIRPNAYLVSVTVYVYVTRPASKQYKRYVKRVGATDW